MKLRSQKGQIICTFYLESVKNVELLATALKIKVGGDFVKMIDLSFLDGVKVQLVGSQRWDDGER